MTTADKAPVRIWCTDRHDGSNTLGEFWDALLPPYVLDSKTPEILFHEPFGKDFLNFDCVRIFFTGENLCPDFNRTDYALSFDHLEFGDRHLRLPLWVLYKPARELIETRPAVVAADLAEREFCLSVVSNGRWVDPRRDAFFHALHACRPVASMGRHLRNDTRLAEAEAANQPQPKLSFANKFLFSLAFENSSAPGYTTEKLLEAFALGTIPIYWGDPLVTRDFNTNAFVNRMDFADDQTCINHVLALAQDPQRMAAMLSAPVYSSPDLPQSYEEKARRFFAEIFARPPEARKRRPVYGWMNHVLGRERRRNRGLRGFLLRRLDRDK